jgi:hypothetical protein
MDPYEQQYAEQYADQYSEPYAYEEDMQVQPANYNESRMSGFTSSAGYTLSDGYDAAKRPVKDAHRTDINQDHLSILLEQGFSTGLARALSANADSFDQRIWIVDNSGSMQIGDGHRVTTVDGSIEMKPVTRWEEIQDTVIYHSQMAAVLNSFTTFRLLNKPGLSVGVQEFAVGVPGKDVVAEIRQARMVMNRTKPDGVTPCTFPRVFERQSFFELSLANTVSPIAVTRHIWDIQAEIRQMLPQLHRSGRRVSLPFLSCGQFLHLSLHATQTPPPCLDCHYYCD